jgi:anaerobic selenocysteine-containing dehydrogenase
MSDPNKLEIMVMIDIAMGEATAWADYVLPDTTYFERWSAVSTAPTILTKMSGVRQPVVGSLDVNMNYTPVLPNTRMLEDILIGLANVMGLPENMLNAWDYYRQLIANVGAQESGPGSDYVLARGGRFENYGLAYDVEKIARRFSGRLFFFSEYLAKLHDSMTGQYFDGMAKYEAPADALDNPIAVQDSAFPLQLITYKKAWHTQMHTIRYPWLVSIQPGNFVELSRQDADARGIQTGDRVRLTSASAPDGIVGLALVAETIKPGVVAVSHHFGHWEMSSRPHEVDGEATSYDPTRKVGITANPIMRADPVLPNVTLQDKVGGSASFYDTYVEVVRA